MANDREVNLRIRAKNETSKDVDAAKSSLKDLVTAIADTVKAASKGGDAIGDLGRTLGTLTRQASGISAFGKIAGQVEKVSTSVKSLEGDVRASAEEFARLARETENASRIANRLRGQQEAEKRNLDALTTERKAAAKSLREESKELERAEKLLASYNEGKGKAPKATRGTGIEAGLPVTSARASAGVLFAGEIENQRARVAAATKALADYDDAVKASTNALKGYGTQVDAAVLQERKLASETEKSSSSRARLKSALEGERAILAQIAPVAEQASAAMGGLAVTQEAATRAAARQAAEMARVKAQIAGLNSGQPRSGSADITSDTKDAAARRQAVERLRAVNKEMAAAQAEAQRLNAAFRSATEPTAEMGEAAGRAQARVRSLKDELSDLRTRLRASTTGFREWSASVGTIATSTSQVRTALPPIAPMAQAAGKGLTEAGKGGEKAAEGIRKASEDSRKSLSLMQRLRGEVLALATGYLGLQAALRGMGGVITAFQTLESAQSRLGVVFNQDTSRVSKELDFLQRQAERLGIQFGSLADQYGKFAVAAQAANFTNEETRKAFLSVAEAARVNKLSLDQTQGVFKALEQMMSKGKVSAEELRGQLGDRLTGAFTIFASAIGKTTAELDEMMKKGEVAADSTTILKFADELNKRFGPQLAAALRSTSTEIGRFQNNIYQAQLRVAEGGFIDGFTKALRSLNEYFQSREGRDFFLSIGAALGKFASALAELPKYFNEIKIALTVFASLKIASVLGNMISAIKASQVATVAASGSIFAWSNNVQAAQGRLAALTGAFSSSGAAIGFFRTQMIGAAGAAAIMGTRFVAIQAGLGALRMAAGVTAGAFRLLWLAVGGLPGIILTGITIALGSWLTSVEDTTRNIDEHKRIMGEVLSAYEAVKNTTKQWGKEIKNVTLDQANANLREMQKSLEDVRKETSRIEKSAFGGDRLYRLSNNTQAGDNIAPGQAAIAKQMLNARNAFQANTISADAYVKKLEELYATATDPRLQEIGEKLLVNGRAAKEATDRVGAAALAAQNLGNTSADVAKIVSTTGATMDKLTGSTTETGEAFKGAVPNIGEYDKAITTLKGHIPELAEEMKKLKDIGEITSAGFTALSEAIKSGDFSKIREAIELTWRAGQANYDKNRNYEAEYTATRGTATGAQLEELVRATSALAEKMGVSAKDLITAMSYETGGTLNKWQAGPTTQWGQHRGLIQWGEPQRQKYGVTEESSITQQVEAAGKYLVDAGVKSGDGLLQIYAAINAGDSKKINASDANNGGAPGTVLDKVQGQMDNHKARAEGLLATYGGVAKEAEKTAQKEVQAAEATTKRLADGEFELAQQKLINEGKGKQAAIEKAIREAKAENPKITEDELTRIRETTGALYEQQQVKTGETEAIKAANLAMQEANNLFQNRITLMRQLKDAQASGNTELTDSLSLKLTDVNAKLQEAITKAYGMWEAVGGAQAAAKLPALDNMKQKIEGGTKSIGLFGLKANQVQSLVGSFADGIVGVFDSFAQAVANGENAFKAMGQAFLQFAANFLREIATMILKQALLNALKNAFSGGSGIGGSISSAAGALLGTAHTGGVVGGGTRIGGGNSTRRISSAAFGAMATRYHTGGIAGVRPDEVPAILQKNEEVLTANDPRHRNNGGLQLGAGQGGTGAQEIKLVNTFDPKMADQLVSSATGQKAILNVLHQNKDKLKSILGK